MTRVSRAPVLRTGEEEPAPKQDRSLEKRKKLLRAARLLFAQKGYEATSIQQIAAKGGAAAGAFYIYFHSKRQMLVVLMNELLERLASLNLQPTGGDDLKTGLRDFLGRVFRTDREYYGVVRAWQEAALSNAELGAMQRTVEAWTHARILGVFQLLRQHPKARRDCDLPAFARMMDRHFWSLLARGSRMSPRDFDHEVELAADVIYHYLFHDSRRG
ncbi:MAG: helix-turn-helix domain-containing protein [Candidatus Sulfotelmatobacter sp.]